MQLLSIKQPQEGTYFHRLAQINGTPALVIDCRVIRHQYLVLQSALPGVRLYYAIKALPHTEVVAALAELGAGFEIAGSGELQLLRQARVKPRDTIHTHPIKRDNDIRQALRFGCTTFVIDNTEELLKFIPYKHRVGLILRLRFRSRDAVVDLSRKFGCPPQEAYQLIALATRLGIHVKGLSFHVGSQCLCPDMHVQAINVCNRIIRQTHDLGAAPISLLDIGGGFPVAYDQDVPSIEAFSAPIVQALNRLPRYVTLAAEPGRFLVAPAGTALLSIIGKAWREGQIWYYLDDGIYGLFSGQVFDHTRYPLEVFSESPKRYPSVLAGPTCDGTDVIAENLMLPELEIGDFLVGRQMGAYTIASATRFNSLPPAQVAVLDSRRKSHDACNATGIESGGSKPHAS